MVRGSQELIFLSSLSLPLFSFALCFVCLGLDLDRNSAVQLEMSWICWQVGALERSLAHSLCAVFTPNGKMHKIPHFNFKGGRRMNEEGKRKKIKGPRKCIWTSMILLLFFSPFLIFCWSLWKNWVILHHDSRYFFLTPSADTCALYLKGENISLFWIKQHISNGLSSSSSKQRKWENLWSTSSSLTNLTVTLSTYEHKPTSAHIYMQALHTHALAHAHKLLLMQVIFLTVNE